MVLLVQLFEALAGDVGVDGGGGNIGVAQQQLHHAQIRAVIEQGRGENMTRDMARPGVRPAQVMNKSSLWRGPSSSGRASFR